MRIMKATHWAIWLAELLLVAALGMAMPGRCADATSSTDPLLDLFVQKGFVTQQEAEQVEAEAAALRTNQTQMPSLPASKWEMSPAIKGTELFGDVRLRYEDRSAEDPAGNQIDLQRLRYAVRLGLRGDLFDNFYYGVRLDTSANPRSPFVTMGTTATVNGYNSGPFGKSAAGLNIGQVYIGWHPEDWVDLTIGKMPNPLYTSTMVWSANIAPEGFAERFKYPVGPAQFFANFGQFLYDDLNPDFSSGDLGVNSLFGQNTDNIFMFAWQGGVNYQITTNLSAKIAGTLYNYIGLQQSSQNTFGSLAPYYGDPYVGEGAYYLEGETGYAPGYSGWGTPGTFPGYGSVNYPFNQVGLNDLKVLEIPFEVNFKFDHLEARLFGDYAYNLDGGQRAEAAAAAYQAVEKLQNTPTPNSFPAQKGDVKAYQFGLGIGTDDIIYGPMQGLVYGTSSPRHSWEVRTYWQHVEQYSLDPNILDTDFFSGVENLQGIYVAAAYAFTGNLIGTFRYGHASRINDLLGTGGSGQDIPQINPINNFDIYQVDFTVRF
jgi:Putative porin